MKPRPKNAKKYVCPSFFKLHLSLNRQGQWRGGVANGEECLKNALFWNTRSAGWNAGIIGGSVSYGRPNSRAVALRFDGSLEGPRLNHGF